MRSRAHHRDSSSSERLNDVEPSKNKFKPEHGKKLAFMSLMALCLSALVGLWYPLLQSQPLVVSIVLSIGHLVIVCSMGNSFLPCHFYVWFQACILGVSLATGALIVVFGTTIFPFGIYVIILSAFHYGEFFVTALTNPNNLSLDSFLLNHSVAYWVAAVASWVEFFLEVWLAPIMKSFHAITLVGLVVCIAGDFLRKLAMFHAGRSFSHLVQYSKKDDHQLVTTGVYSFCRHPSYVGWFYWSVGTQIILCNPFCLVAYTFVSWKFFHERVFIEEATLLNFFGSDYFLYQKKVPVGIPFIKGFEEFDED